MENRFKLVTLTLLFFLCVKYCSPHSLQKRAADPSLDENGKIRPFCAKVVGKTVDGPLKNQICKNVTDFIIDATVLACDDSLDKILEAIAESKCKRDHAQLTEIICPLRETIETRIKDGRGNYCEAELQTFFNELNKNVDDICLDFAEKVRRTCLKNIASYCEYMDFPSDSYEKRCKKDLPGIICD